MPEFHEFHPIGGVAMVGALGPGVGVLVHPARAKPRTARRQRIDEVRRMAQQ
ncbi:hypothetical protein MANY_36270 [Mycolicibacterium anyangense]|uniref:Uncharacterized protein n=1 Tax=Mycolicibacterium anyangense TaxID=1431246 RepID=A0A6N4W8G6_9MYCO|nr:hypothetical protein MANY_36270 [Mycolicibacterium anyangense]